MAEAVIVDASAMVDFLVGSPLAAPVEDRLRGHDLHAPGHFAAEVLSALGRLHRSGHLTARQVEARLERLAAAPVQADPLSPLVVGAWRRRHNLRLVDALYAELAGVLDIPVVTTDEGLAATLPSAHLVTNLPRA